MAGFEFLVLILAAICLAAGIRYFVRSRSVNRTADSVYHYYIVDNNFAARVRQDTASPAAERLMPDGTWEPYDDLWDVCTNGRHVGSERKALEEARDILELRGVEHGILKN